MPCAISCRIPTIEVGQDDICNIVGNSGNQHTISCFDF